MLGHEDALPSELLAAAQQQPTVRDFLDALGEEQLRELRGRVYCVQTDDRDEFELKKTADGTSLDTLLDKRRELAAEHAQAEVYLGELRRVAKYRHEADGRWAKTVLRHHYGLVRSTKTFHPTWPGLLASHDWIETTIPFDDCLNG